MKLKVYMEGGGDTRELKSRCREGFSEFLRKAGLENRMPRIVAGGSRQQTFGQFCTALGKARTDEFTGLLVDSEAAVPPGTGPWAHLDERDGWVRPKPATDDNAQLMVQCMEAWFLADRDGLAGFFGNGFNRKVLPACADVENIAKSDLFAALRQATRRCTTKGEYGKGRHSFGILGRIDPGRVMAASPHAERLVETLMRQAGVRP